MPTPEKNINNETKTTGIINEIKKITNLNSNLLLFKNNLVNQKKVNIKNSPLVCLIKKAILIKIPNNIIFRLRQDTTDLKNYIDSLYTIMGDPVKVNDSTWHIDWSIAYIYDEYNYDRYSGRTRIGLRGIGEFLDDVIIFHQGTSLLERDSQIRLTWGQKYENGGVRIFARTAHPAFEAQFLEGVYVDYPRKRNWFTGFGIGPSINIGWDVVNSRPALIIGGGIHYSIYQW